MAIRKHTRESSKKIVDFSRIERFHPYKTFLFFALVGSTILFLSFSFLYYLSVSRAGTPESFILPKAFSVSTVLLLLSSLTISRITKGYRNDSFFEIKSALTITVILAIGFCISQVSGWKQIYTDGFQIRSDIGISYLYLISGIHFLHVAGGLAYLTYITVKVYMTSTNLAKALLFFSDEFQLTRIQLIQAYWHFVDFLWIFLFLMFLFTF